MSRSLTASIVSLLLLGGSLTAVSTALHQHVKADGGLTQTVFSRPDFSGEVVQRTTTAVVDLSLLVRDDTLPRRLFSIRWSGIWRTPADATYEFFLGADDRALLTIDGVAMVERSPTLGMSTASATRALDAGSHTFQLDYEQHRGASRLNLQVASDGRTPGPLDPYSLFPTEPTAASVRVGLAAKVSQRAAFIVWSAFGVMLVGIAGHRVLALVQAPPRSWSRITSRAHSFFDSVRTILPMVCAGVALSIVAYATLLRIDAITTRYGPLEQSRWAQALQNASDRFETWQPALGWRPVDHPYVGGDPINYIRFAKEMESFYGRTSGNRSSHS